MKKEQTIYKNKEAKPSILSFKTPKTKTGSKDGFVKGK